MAKLNLSLLRRPYSFVAVLKISDQYMSSVECPGYDTKLDLMLRNVEYTFIVITPRSTLDQSCSTYQSYI